MAVEAHFRSEKYQRKIDPIISILRDKVVAGELMWKKWFKLHEWWLRYDDYIQHLAVTEGIPRLFLSRFKTKLWKIFSARRKFTAKTLEKKIEEIMLQAEELGIPIEIIGLIIRKSLEVPLTAPKPPYFEYTLPPVISHTINVLAPKIEVKVS